VTSLEEQIAAGIETHLYLTDYRSLYVAELEEVTDEAVLRETSAEAAHIPGYYTSHRADFWFRLVTSIASDPNFMYLRQYSSIVNVT
jgi:hypothetical protein